MRDVRCIILYKKFSIWTLFFDMEGCLFLESFLVVVYLDLKSSVSKNLLHICSGMFWKRETENNLLFLVFMLELKYGICSDIFQPCFASEKASLVLRIPTLQQQLSIALKGKIDAFWCLRNNGRMNWANFWPRTFLDASDSSLIDHVSHTKHDGNT